LDELCREQPGLRAELSRRLRVLEAMQTWLSLDGFDARGMPPGAADEGEDLPQPPGYEVDSLVDRGGMGVVYRARQTELRRVVAIKMLAAERAGPKQVARFRDEAEAIARLHHPNIVQIFEVGQYRGRPFFSMEFVAGGTLAQHLADRRPDAAEAARLVQTLAAAIHYAHENGVVHRDLKPGNVLLAVSDQLSAVSQASVSGLKADRGSLTAPKITDFGLAKRLDEGSGHTRTGEILGTPHYMAPEQAEGRIRDIGPRTDVYSLGTILYEALTGRPPFVDDSPVVVLRRIVNNDAAAPSKLNRSVPRDLDAICLRCLEKRPQDRYATAGELADDLGRFLRHEATHARPISIWRRTVRWAKRHPERALAMALVLALVGLLGTQFVVQWAEEREQERQREERRQRAIAVAPQAMEILKRNCFECHGADASDVKKKLLVLDHDILVDPRRKIVVPGLPHESLLIRRIEDGSMPPEEEEDRLPRLARVEMQILKEWILGGAPEFPPEDPARPTPPVVPDSPLAAEVKEIFIQRCTECHRSSVAKGGIKILYHDLLVNQREMVKPGHPEKSRLYELITLPAMDEDRMPPPDKDGLPPREIETIRKWILDGAKPFPKSK
jgi:mono/diheme cytochrome c family protein